MAEVNHNKTNNSHNGLSQDTRLGQFLYAMTVHYFAKETSIPFRDQLFAYAGWASLTQLLLQHLFSQN
ncbi:hypothetical protein FORC065_0476 [Yersinia enterocolitica]|nr:hypothetical protein FORC065_0476 [Yersinia enterocolitica]